MMPRIHWRLIASGLLLSMAAPGCHFMELRHPEMQATVPHSIPREHCKVILPDYTIEPPDILTIDALHLIPLPPYRLTSLDVIVIQATGTLPDAAISGAYPIEPGGIVKLGGPYGSVKVSGLTVEEAKAAIEQHLKKVVLEPVVEISLGEIAGKQQIAGEHLVAPDGKVNLGSYGRVSVVGKTVEEATVAIEEHLSRSLENPKISLDVYAYNSKFYYVITEGAGLGDQATRFPIMGNETVLDAISQINGLTSVSSKRIWIARPGRNCDGCDQVLPVDWVGITQRAEIETNYQILPGDRVFVAQDKLVALDTALGKFISPLERIFGVTLLGTNTASRVKFFNRGTTNNANP